METASEKKRFFSAAAKAARAQSADTASFRLPERFFSAVWSGKVWMVRLLETLNISVFRQLCAWMWKGFRQPEKVHSLSGCLKIAMFGLHPPCSVSAQPRFCIPRNLHLGVSPQPCRFAETHCVGFQAA